jgi:hypothetical protein
MKILLTSLVVLLAAIPARAELKWDRQRVELKPGPGDTFVDATFGFVNSGSEPVIIEKLAPSCGCTTATVPKMTIEPGERSELVTRFDITGRRGLQTKTVTVMIKGQKEPDIVTLVVSIPDLMKILPQLVIWEKGEAGRPKTISLHAENGVPVKVLNVLSSESRLKARLEPIKEGEQYAIVVTPDSTASACFSVLSINVELKGEQRVLRAFAQVKETQR